MGLSLWPLSVIGLPLVDAFSCNNITPLKWHLPAALHFLEPEIPKHLSPALRHPTFWAAKGMNSFQLQWLHCLLVFPAPSCLLILVSCPAHLLLLHISSELCPVRPGPNPTALTWSDFSLLCSLEVVFALFCYPLSCSKSSIWRTGALFLNHILLLFNFSCAIRYSFGWTPVFV